MIKKDSNNHDNGTIIFIHRGNQFYLKPALAQARVSNPLVRIVLLGDNSNSDLGASFCKKYKIDHFLIDNYFQSAKKFEQIYQHQGKNPYQYELFCFQRWFVMLDFVKEHCPKGNFVYLDTDVIIYINIFDVFKVIKSEMTVCNRVGPQYSFFKSVDALESYCEFINYSYKNSIGFDKLKSFVSDFNNSGMPHISDMTTIGVYASENDLDDLGDCNRTDFFFDEIISYPQCMKKGVFGKKIIKKYGINYFQKSNGQLIKAAGCHLQGGSKALWPLYCDRSLLLSLLNVESIYFFIRYSLRISIDYIRRLRK